MYAGWLRAYQALVHLLINNSVHKIKHPFSVLITYTQLHLSILEVSTLCSVLYIYTGINVRLPYTNETGIDLLPSATNCKCNC